MSPFVLAGPALAAQPTTLWIRVVDPEGRPVPNAAIVFPVERDHHVVLAATGECPINVLYLPDGTEVLFRPGVSLEFDVLAAGWIPDRVAHVLGRGRKDRVDVVLRPMDLTVSAVPAPPEIATLASITDWIRLEREPVHDDAWAVRTSGARQRTEHHALAWLAWQADQGGSDGRAAAICRLATNHPDHCEP